MNTEFTILCIDDDEDILRLLRSIFSKTPYRVLTADSGPKGLNVLAGEKCDIVLLDYQMPGMNGIEVLKSIKVKYPRIKVLMLTSYTEVTLIVNAIKIGATDYLLKPLDSDYLLTQIERLSQSHSLERENLILKQQFKQVNDVSDGVYFVDVNRIITFWNNGAERITGYTAAEVVGTACSDSLLVHVDDEGNQLFEEGCPLFGSIENREIRNQKVYLRHKEGHLVNVDVTVYDIKTPDGEIVGAVELFKDINRTDIDPEAIEYLKQDNHFDVTTGLVNRRHVEMKLDTFFEEFIKHNVPFGIIMADIDNLSEINKDHGTEFGDKVVKMVAKTLLGNVKSRDMFGRWDGGKFAGIIMHANEKKLMLLSNKLRMLVEKSFIYQNNSNVGVTISIGVTIAQSYDSTTSLIERAIILLSKAKSSGKNKVVMDFEDEDEDKEPHKKRKVGPKQSLFDKRTMLLNINIENALILIFILLLSLLFLWTLMRG